MALHCVQPSAHGVQSASTGEVAPPASAVDGYPAESTIAAKDFCVPWNGRKSPERVLHELGRRTVGAALPYHGQCNHTGKVFGVGVFKTGTTSLSTHLRQLGYTPCGYTQGWYGIGNRELFFQNFDGPSLRKSIQAKPVLRDYVRALANATLSATDGPWLFHHQVIETLPRRPSPPAHHQPCRRRAH